MQNKLDIFRLFFISLEYNMLGEIYTFKSIQH